MLPISYHRKRAKERAEHILSKGKEVEEGDEEVVEDLKAYPTSDQYPSDTMPHQIKVSELMCEMGLQ